VEAFTNSSSISANNCSSTSFYPSSFGFAHFKCVPEISVRRRLFFIKVGTGRSSTGACWAQIQNTKKVVLSDKPAIQFKSTLMHADLVARLQMSLDQLMNVISTRSKYRKCNPSYNLMLCIWSL
jgi:hypothetical protein